MKYVLLFLKRSQVTEVDGELHLLCFISKWLSKPVGNFVFDLSISPQQVIPFVNIVCHFPTKVQHVQSYRLVPKKQNKNSKYSSIPELFPFEQNAKALDWSVQNNNFICVNKRAGFRGFQHNQWIILCYHFSARYFDHHYVLRIFLLH